MKRICTLFSIFFSLHASAQHALSPFAIVYPKAEKLKLLPLGAVKPTGWIKEQIRENLNGFTGHLDSLAPDLMVKDAIYGANRIRKNAKPKDLGAFIGDEEAKEQLYWWNSETQSNLWDGYLRSVALLDETTCVYSLKAKAYVAQMRSYQDADGYWGIYDRGLRYQSTGENGELWAQTTLLRGMLGWYDYTRDKALLGAINRAVANVMANYPVGKSHPFFSKNPNVSGTSHGLVFTDVLERLYQLTGQEKYRRYALFLYQDFSAQTLNEDAQLKKVLDPTLRLNGHGVHTYEHFRVLAAAAYASGNPALAKAQDAYWAKIQANLLPSGAPIGDEFILGHAPKAASTGYEYCSVHEQLHNYISVLAKTGQTMWGDKAEQILYNAAEGARHPTESCIAYLKTDNSYAMDGRQNFSKEDPKQVRYKYSPVHREAAVCCVPNAGRILPYYTQAMWMKDAQGLVATLFGPCSVKTTINGATISIKEETSYPFSDSIRFGIEAAKPTRFILKIRVPAWAKEVQASLPYNKQNGYLCFSQTWEGTSTLNIHFGAAVERHGTAHKEAYFTYGPWVLAHAIPSRDSITKTYTTPGFRDIAVLPTDSSLYAVGDLTSPRFIGRVSGVPQFSLDAFRSGTKPTNIVLRPMWGTTLRQVTFPVLHHE